MISLTELRRLVQGPHGPELRVLQVLNPPDGTTRYSSQMAEIGTVGPSVTFFSWRQALMGRFDVLHVHWPEYLLRAGNPVLRLAKRIGFTLLLRRLARRRIAVVRTIHNLTPHDPGPLEETQLLRRLDDMTTLYVRLNAHTEVPDGKPIRTILHGHYIDRFAELGHAQPVRGRLLYFGLIKQYKGIEQLLDVFCDIPDLALELRVVGQPANADLRERVVTAAARDPRISLNLAFVSDAEMVAEISGAELVVLPYLESHNSGVLLVALSVGRPVLVMASSVNDSIAREVGPGWVHQFDGPLGPELLEQTLAAVRTAPRSPVAPLSSERSWSSVAQRHRDMYRDAIARRAAPHGRS